MRTLLAWWLISANWHSRPMYDALAKLFASRAYRGINPLHMLFDGSLMTFIGLLVVLMPLVAAVTFPITSLWLFCFDRDSFNTTRDLVRAGRIGWSTGTILDPQKEPADGGEAQK